MSMMMTVIRQEKIAKNSGVEHYCCSHCCYRKSKQVESASWLSWDAPHPETAPAAADVLLSSDLLETVLKAGVRGGGEEEFKQVLALYHSHHLTEVVYYHFYYHWCEPVSDSKLVYHILSFLRSRHFVILMHVLTAGQIKMHSCSCLHPRAYPPSAYATLCIQPHG